MQKIQRVLGWVALSYPVWVVLYWLSWSNMAMVGVIAGEESPVIATVAVYALLGALWCSLLALIAYCLLRLAGLVLWLHRRARNGARP